MTIFQKFTLKSLWANKVRTAAAVVGIVLSVALFTAVSTGVSSLMDYLQRVAGETKGVWHVEMLGVKEADVSKLTGDSEVEDYGVLHTLGYAKLEKPWNKKRPYLFVGACEGKISELCPAHLIRGRMPENSGEILLPDELLKYGNTGCKMGDTLTLTLGLRLQEGLPEVSTASYKDEQEEWKKTGTASFKVVGVYQSSFYEAVSRPGYTLLTKADASMRPEAADVYVTLKEPEGREAFCERIDSLREFGEVVYDINDTYLKYSRISLEGTAGKVLGGLLAILMGIIMFGSISLIYNSFSISINERKKQYGLLSSVGATRKQLRRSVIFESLVLSVIGIPLGVAVGIGGLSITFYCLRDTFARFLQNEINGTAVQLSMSASLFSVLMAVALSFVTVLLSAWIPAWKVMKVSAVEVIRQTDDVKVSPRSLRVSFITRRLFGLPGTLGAKNFKRNKRRYRATVVSLFVSIVIFVSTSSFCDYISSSLEQVVDVYSSDLYYSSDDVKSLAPLYEKLSQARGITKSGYYYVSMDSGDQLALDFSKLSESFRERCGIQSVDTEHNPEEKTQIVDMRLVFVNDDNYREFLKENHLDVERFMNVDKPVAVMNDQIRDYDSVGMRYKSYYALETPAFKTKFLWKKGKTGDDIFDEFERGIRHKPTEIMETVPSEKKLDAQGRLLLKREKFKYTYKVDELGNAMQGRAVEGSEKWVPMEEAYQVTEMEVGARAEKEPYGVERGGSGIELFYPASAMKTVMPHTPESGCMAFDSSDPDQSYMEMCNYMEEMDMAVGELSNAYHEVQVSKALMTVINVFSYGFIILISLIALTNVFNTISTNISVRRREFAMLRSMGMTKSGFNKMMCYECLLYGFKGLAFGLPAAIGVTFLIYSVVTELLLQDFYVPWYSIAISVFSVFFVVFATMMYAVRKVKKDNVVDTLKLDN